MKYRAAIAFSLWNMILVAWEALWFGQKPSVETSRKENKLKARMIFKKKTKNKKYSSLSPYAPLYFSRTLLFIKENVTL